MFSDLLVVLDELVAQELLEMRADALQARDPVDNVTCKVKSVQIVEDGHIERSGRCSLLFVSADVEIVMIGAPVGQTMDQPWIAVVCKDDRLVDGEYGVEVTIGKSVGMFG